MPKRPKPTYINLPDKVWASLVFHLPHQFGEDWNPNATLPKVVTDLMSFHNNPLQLAVIRVSFSCLDTTYGVDETLPISHPFEFLFLNAPFKPALFMEYWNQREKVVELNSWSENALQAEIAKELRLQKGNCGPGFQTIWSTIDCDSSFLHLPELEGEDTYAMSYNYQWSQVTYPIIQTELGASIGGPCNYDTRPPLTLRVVNGLSGINLIVYPDWSYFTHPNLPGWSWLQSRIAYLKQEGWEMTHGDQWMANQIKEFK